MKMILLLLHHVHYEPLLDKMKAKMVKKNKTKDYSSPLSPLSPSKGSHKTK
jgi:hypothetical protein